MARLFPSRLVGAVAPEIAKVLQALKRIPGDEFLVWVRLPFDDSWRPALMAIDGQRSCYLFSVSNLTESQAEALLQQDLFGVSAPVVEPSAFEASERGQLHAFIECALVSAGVNTCDVNLPIEAVIACPNVPQALLDQIAGRGNITDCKLWGREMLRADALTKQISEAAEEGLELPQSVINALRQKFSPEIGIPERMVSRVQEKPSRNVGAQLTGYLLDLNQEFLAKEDLSFSQEAEAAARELRLRLVTGVAGSGKSLILLYRAMLQARFQPKARILILTHNRPLSGELRERFRRLCPEASAEWTTFYQWCREFSGVRWEIIKPWDRETLICELAGANPVLARLPRDFIEEEIDWIRDQGIFSRQEYLGVARLGRKRPLHDEQRNAMFSLLVAYSRELKKRQLEDWTGAAAAVWRRVERGMICPPMYDSVLVDEAQFFAPTWLQLVRRSVRPGTGQLFLAADPTQGFLKRRQSWTASGLNVRGHSTRLLRCYRNSREILGFACAFYRSRVPADEEEINLPVPEEIAALEPGEAPQLILVDSPQGERARVANEIASALRAGANPEHFLVLQSDSAIVAPFIETLNRCYGRPIAKDLKDYTAGATGKVRVSSLNAATGLESAVVFLCGLDALIEREKDLHLDADQRSELIRDNTRRIYMGMTRASQKLLITYRRPATRALLAVGAGP